MGKKFDNYISMLNNVRQLEQLLIERVKKGNHNIEFTWTSDGCNELPGEFGMKNIEPDGSQTFTFKFGRDK